MQLAAEALGAELGCHGCLREHVSPQLWELGVPARWGGGALGSALDYDFVGRLEAFDRDFARLMALLRAKNGNWPEYALPGAVPKLNAQRHPQAREIAAAVSTKETEERDAALRLLYYDDLRCIDRLPLRGANGTAPR